MILQRAGQVGTYGRLATKPGRELSAVNGPGPGKFLCPGYSYRVGLSREPDRENLCSGRGNCWMMSRNSRVEVEYLVATKDAVEESGFRRIGAEL